MTAEISTLMILERGDYMQIISNKRVLEHYRLTAIDKIGAVYNLIYGEKSNGKSYAVKEKVLKNFCERGEQMVLLRRYDSEIKKSRLDSYWSDMPIDIISGGKYNEVYSYGGDLFVAFNEGGKRKNAKRFGYSRALNLAQSYSGTEYPDVTTILLEEFISLDGRYLPNELFLFNHMISTVARRRTVTVYCLANTISRISPYWREFSVDEVVKTQGQGTICVIKRETAEGDVQKIAIEYCANTKGRSLMFAGARGAMINEGKWLVQEQPRLPYCRPEWECPYLFIVEYKGNKYKVEYLVRGDEYCLYVTPKTTPIKSNTRVCSDRSASDPLHTLGLFPLTQEERQIFALFNLGKVFYSDNQTGTEFKECLTNIKRVFT